MVKKKLVQYKQKWLNHVTHDTQNNSLAINLSQDEDLDDHKETTGWIQLWGQNRSFIGLTL